MDSDHKHENADVAPAADAEIEAENGTVDEAPGGATILVARGDEFPPGADPADEDAASAAADAEVEAEALAELEPGGSNSDASGGVEEPVQVITAGKVSEELKAVIEALIFASPDPLTPKTLFKVMESEPKEDVQVSLEALRRDYADRPGALHLVEVAGGYQIVTRPELSEWVRRLFHERKTAKLSVQALETLAVIAYKQPITGPEITEIRGVNTSGVIATLIERHLIKISGRKAVVGRPFLYSTTREFLIRFGLRDLNDLPKIEDIADVLGFEPPAGLTDATPADTLLPLDEGNDPDKSMAATPEGESAAAAEETTTDTPEAVPADAVAVDEPAADAPATETSEMDAPQPEAETAESPEPGPEGEPEAQG